MRVHALSGSVLALALSACASSGSSRHAMAPTGAQDAVPRAVADEIPQADREAILAMAGEYRVSFDFRETVVLAEGYRRTEPKESGAYETVVVVTDEPGRIVLQHLLVSRDGGHVTKHWRQDWLWQAEQRLEFSDEQTWLLREVAPERRAGSWTQCVYEVSDAPRYCGTGRWNHRYGVATWTSDRSWRPLPRREYTVRDDYNALNVENRHTVTPGGWSHEQDNTKTKRSTGGQSTTLVREFGFNDYVRLAPGDFDFSPAYSYWRKTQDYWARVREAWSERIAAGQGVHLAMPIDGMPMIIATFTQADREGEGDAVPDRELSDLFDQYVRPPSARISRAGR